MSVDESTTTMSLEQLKLIVSKLNSIELKLEGMDASIKLVQQSVNEVKTDMIMLKEKVKNTTTKVDHVEGGLSMLEKDVGDVKKAFTVLDARSKERYTSLSQKVLYQEAYSRRENLKFVGIPETKERESGDETKGVLFNFLEEKLHLEDAKGIEFQRVHRLGRASNGQPRLIIARFLRYADREYVLHKARNLKGTNFVIYEDLPKEILDNRRPQISKLKEAKRNGQRAAFSKREPDKLYIDGKFIPA